MDLLPGIPDWLTCGIGISLLAAVYQAWENRIAARSDASVAEHDRQQAQLLQEARRRAAELQARHPTATIVEFESPHDFARFMVRAGRSDMLTELQQPSRN